MFLQELLQHAFIFRVRERAGGVDEPAGGWNESRGGRQNTCLPCGAVLNRARRKSRIGRFASADQRLAAAGCIDQHGIEDRAKGRGERLRVDVAQDVPDRAVACQVELQRRQPRANGLVGKQPARGAQ